MTNHTNANGDFSASTGQRRFFPAHSVIFTTGDRADGMYQIKSGQVRIEYHAPGHEPRRLATLGSGDFVGEMSVIDDSPRSASAVAEQDTDTVFFSTAESLELVRLRPDLALALLRNLSGRIRTINQRYFEDMVQQERLAIAGRLMTSVLHDLKNPLAVISIATHLASQESVAHDARLRALERIPLQIEVMRGLMTELAEYALGSPAVSQKSVLPCAKVIESVARQLQPTLALRKISLALEIRGDLGDVAVDYQRVCRVIELLVDHAADELNGSGGRISLTGETRERDVVIEVSGHGQGNLPEDTNEVFEPFAYRPHGNNWGLRLAICKRIVTEHGGRISARRNPDSGSAFVFHLPLAAPAAATTPVLSEPIPVS